MGKQIISQHRGRGSTTYRVPPKSFQPDIRYGKEHGTVVDIVSNTIMDAPLAKVKYPDNSEGYIIAREGMKVGDSTTGMVRTLADVPEGSQIFALETYPDSGPKLCRSPGSFAIIVSKAANNVVVQLPSKKTMKLPINCRVSLGIPAGEGRRDKPFLKAGRKFFLMRTRGKLYPRTKGNRMNKVDHPFGGSGHGKRKSPVSRDAPPGRKVGAIAPRRTGRAKK